jgi:hypothetical protein
MCWFAFTLLLVSGSDRSRQDRLKNRKKPVFFRIPRRTVTLPHGRIKRTTTIQRNAKRSPRRGSSYVSTLTIRQIEPNLKVCVKKLGSGFGRLTARGRGFYISEPW